MSDDTANRKDSIALWRARATLGGRAWSDAAYGFGGPDVAEAIGTSDEVGGELTGFLDSLGRQEVAAEYLRSGSFFVRLEVEPHERGASTLATRRIDYPAEDRVPQWQATASDGNADGVFDACYSYGNSKGDEGHLLGTTQDLGAELSRVLTELTRDDVETMKYGTDRFFIELMVELPPKK